MTDHPVRLPSEPAIEAAARIRWERTESDSSPTKQWADAPTWIQKAFRETAALELQAAYAVDGAALRVPAQEVMCEHESVLKGIFCKLRRNHHGPHHYGADVPAQEAPRPDFAPHADEYLQTLGWPDDKVSQEVRDGVETHVRYFARWLNFPREGAAPRAVEGAADLPTEFVVPEAPPHWNNTEANAWGSGYESGFLSGWVAIRAALSRREPQ